LPFYAAILTVFAHRLEGPDAAIKVLRGLVLGLFAFAAFFLVLALMLERAGTAVAFTAAVAVTLTLQGASLWVLRRVSNQ
jgi:cell division protein FtsW (lipid II flippase)